MAMDEKDCRAKIDALAQEDWQPLLALIPEIENTSKFGEWGGGEKGPDGSVALPWCMPAQILKRFLEAVYTIPVIVGFDWAAWEEGRRLASDEELDFDALDIVAKCKLITAIVKQDRFCEGALVSAFESGVMLKILKSIEKEVIANWTLFVLVGGIGAPFGFVHLCSDKVAKWRHAERRRRPDER